MAYLKITRHGCRPLGYGPLVVDGEPVLRWQHIATGKVVFTCPDIPGFGWRIAGEESEAFGNSLKAIARRVERIYGHSLETPDRLNAYLKEAQ